VKLRSVIIGFLAGVAIAAPAVSGAMKTVVHLPVVKLAPAVQEKTVSVDVQKARAELLRAASSRGHDVTLEMDVESDRPPTVFYEVSLSAPNAKRYSLGNLAMFGAGIRSESRGEFHPAHVQFVISEAVAGILRSGSVRTLAITFTPKAAEGVALPKNEATLTIGKAAIVIGPRLRE
jgi:hypothetical protein